MTEKYILDIAYLIASITFILGLKYLGHPETARKGNLIAAAGMTIGILATVFLYKNDAGKSIGNFAWIFGGIAIGAVIGTVMARKVKMTAMPQMVSLFNGLGALCVAIISVVEFTHYGHTHPSQTLMNGNVLTILLGLMIGCVSFSGSIIAWGKLEGKMGDFTLPLQQIVNMVLLLGMLGVSGYIMSMAHPDNMFIYILLGLSLV